MQSLFMLFSYTQRTFIEGRIPGCAVESYASRRDIQ